MQCATDAAPPRMVHLINLDPPRWTSTALTASNSQLAVVRVSASRRCQGSATVAAQHSCPQTSSTVADELKATTTVKAYRSASPHARLGSEPQTRPKNPGAAAEIAGRVRARIASAWWPKPSTFVHECWGSAARELGSDPGAVPHDPDRALRADLGSRQHEVSCPEGARKPILNPTPKLPPDAHSLKW